MNRILGLTLSAIVALCITGAARAQTMIRFGSASNSVIISPLLLSQIEPDIWGKQGIAITVTDFRGNSSNCVAAVIAQAMDVCQVGTTSGTDAIAEGADLKVIAVNTGPINEIVLSTKTVERLGVKPDAPVADRVRALKGLRIVSSAPGTAHYVTLTYMLRQVGLQMSDLQFRTLGDPLAMMQSIRNNAIDGALWSIGSLGGNISDGTGVRWISIPHGDVPELREVPYVSIYARGDWVQKNPELAAKIQAGLAEAIDRIKKDTGNPSPRIKERFFPQLDQAIWDDGYAQARTAFLPGAKATAAGWAQLLKLQEEATKKDYARAAFDKALLPQARAN